MYVRVPVGIPIEMTGGSSPKCPEGIINLDIDVFNQRIYLFFSLLSFSIRLLLLSCYFSLFFCYFQSAPVAQP
jgi:hypothetical protein